MHGHDKLDYRNPQIRRFHDGKPNSEIIQPLNRSAAIRQILTEHGIDLPLASIKNHMLREGYKLPADRTIADVRIQLKKSRLPTAVAKAQDILQLARRLIRKTGSLNEAVAILKKVA
ncbi:MAG: hypothetical protein B7Z37_20990 [Verrucomicrobia bacterium 12-59-8]|nr:MAG: hypothetical protein B7Z37_20990 [Verrucomicrobia bacterium 12-59-8]